MNALHLRHNQVGIGTSLAGTALIFAMVIGINEFAGRDHYDDRVRQTPFEVDMRTDRIEPVAEPEPQPEPEPADIEPPPLAELDSAIGSVDIPVPGLDDRELNLAERGDGDGDLVMTDETVDTPPQPARRAALVYPPSAKRDGIEGHVLLSLLIDDNGAVQRVRVLESVPPGVFDAAATEALYQWQFEPARYQGEQVRVWARQRIRFDLN